MAKLNIITLGSSKNYTDLAAFGLTNVVVNDQDKTISFTLVADGSTRTLHFDQPSDGKDGQDGISITGVNDLGNGKFTLVLSDGSETSAVQTIKGQKGDKGDKLTFNDLSDEEKASLKGDAGVSPTITENADNTDKIYRLDITTADSTFTTPNLKGADGTGGEGASTWSEISDKPFESLSTDFSVENGELKVVGGTGGGEENVQSDWNETDDTADGFIKNKPTIPTKVSQLENDSNYLSSIPEEYVTETELSAKGYLTEHQDISSKVDKVEGKSLISDAEITRLASVDNYDDTALSNRVKSVEDEVPNLATKTYVGEQITNAEHLKREIVTVLPSDTEASDNIIYMLKVESATGNDKYREYMKIDGTVQMVGDTSVDLTDYAKSVEIPTTVAELTDSADYAKTADIPTTLPANGGNADTVNGHTVGIDVPENAKFTDTTYSDATQIEHGLMSVDDKKKLDGLTKYTPDGTTITADEDGTLHGVAEVTVDDALSDTSTNPVQNKVIKAYVDKKASENVDFSTSTSKLLNGSIEAPLVLSKANRNLLNPSLLTIKENDLKDSGITGTINSDGSITLNGTATRSIWSVLYTTHGSGKNNMFEGLRVFSNLNYNKSGVYGELYIAYCKNNDGTKETWRSGHDGDLIPDGNGEPCWVRLHITSGATFNNETFFIMLTDDDAGAVNDKLIPYSGYDIKACGKNLLNLTKITTNNTGATASLSNGIITLDRTVDTSGGWQDIYFNTPEQHVSLKRGVKYTISTKDKVQKVFILLRKATGLEILYTHDCYTNGTTFVASEDMVCQVTITFKESSTFNNTQIAPQIEVGEKATEYEPYNDGGTVHIDSTTEFPLLGLKLFDGITNIISPGNVKCVYPTNESGKGVLDSLYNKDKILTEQNKSLSVIGKCKNLLNPTLQTTTQNGVTCTNNGDGTYTLNGTATKDVILYISGSPTKNTVGGCKLLGCPINGSNDTYRIVASYYENGEWKAEGSDVGNGVIIDGTYSRINYLIKVVSGTTITNLVFKPMLTTNLFATYDDFVPYTGDGETLASDVAEIKNDLGGLTFSASGTTLTITDGTNTWTLGANS